MNILPLPAFTDNYIWLIEENGKATVVDPGDAEVVNNCLKEKNLEKQKNTTTLKKTENKGSKFFSYLIVFIISFVALIILLDTLKTPLINVFPGLEIILFNLFETLQDIKLFIIDLI